MSIKLKTHCKRGHPRTPENIKKNGGCKECNKERNRRYRSTPEGKARDYSWHKKWNENNPSYYRKYAIVLNESCKLETLTYYGKYGKLMCCGRGCCVSDVDMLSLDHINNDGARHRETFKSGSTGVNLYHRLKRKGYPLGFQTLCANHQLKKELIKRRSNRMDK